MLKRLITAMLAISVICTAVPISASDAADAIYISQGFTSFAENQTTVSGLTLSSGLDSRVITDDGDKVLFSRAYGDSVKIKLPAQSYSADTTVFSAKIKITGNKSTGKIFSFVSGSSKFDALTMTADGYVKLIDKKIVSGIPHNVYRTYTLVVKWEEGTYDVYVDKNQKAYGWKLPDGFSPDSVKEINFSLEYNDNVESDLYLDDVRIYDGAALPWNRSFPAEAVNTEVFDFTTTENAAEESTLIKTVEFNGNTSGASVQNVSGGTTTSATDEDGTQYARMYADDKSGGGSFMDINAVDVENYNKYVADLRVKIFELGSQASLNIFDGKNEAGTWRKGFTINPDGSLTSRYSGSKLTSIPIGQWTRLTFCYNIPSAKVDIYVNGEYAATDSCSDTMYVRFFRFDIINKAGSVHDTGIDYVKIYTGSTLMASRESNSASGSVNVDMDSSIMDPTANLKAALSGATVLTTRNDKMYIAGQKLSYPDSSYQAIEYNGMPYIPSKLLSQITNGQAQYNSTDGSVILGGKTVSLADEVVVQSGAAYLPLKRIAEELMGKKLTWDDRGCAVISDAYYEVQRDHYIDRHIQFIDSDLIYRYMIFDNPSGYDMIDTLKQTVGYKQHPRLLWTMNDVEYVLDKVDADSEWRKAYDSLIADAEAELAKDNSSYYNADKSAKQNAASTMQDSITDLAQAYLLTGNPKYAKKGIEIMEGFASWDTLDYSTANLISGHWMSVMAIGYDSFYNYLASVKGGDEILASFRQAALNLAFIPHYDAYSGTVKEPHYMTMQDNFSGVCGGGMMSLLIAMGDEEEVTDIAAYLFQNNIKTLEMAASLFYPNGAYYESVGYSQYMCTNLSIALVGMKNSFGTYYGLDRAKGFTDYAYAHTYLQSTDTCVNFHDGTPGYVYDSLREKWGYLFDIPEQAALARRQKQLMNRKAHIDDLFFYCRAVEGKENTIDLPSLGTDRYFYGAEAGSFCSSMEVSNPTYVGFHGGLTDIPHDMLDLGQFIFESDNIKWATDLDSDKYSLSGYFGENGYNLYRKRPEGENCIVLNPSADPGYYGQKLGARAELVMCDMNKPRGAMAAYDLTDPYERDVNKYIRGYYFGDDRNTLIVQDELDLKGDTEFYWFMQTGESIEIISNTQARLTSSNGKTLLVDVYCSAPDYTLMSMDAKPLPSSPVFEGQDENVGYRKLAIHAPSIHGKVTVAVKLSPENNKYDYTSLSITPIAQWSVPDGQPVPTPKLQSISCNGTLLEQSVSGMEEVFITLPFGTTSVPYISASADIGAVTVTQAHSLADNVEITIAGEGMRTAKVKVKFTVSMERPIYITDELSSVLPTAGAPANMIKPIFSDAENPEDTNREEKLIDDNLDTRCAQKGENAWFEVDFGEVKDINGVAIGFYLGSQRKTYLDILYSKDGVNYKRVFSGTSTGTTDDYEAFAIPGKVRYIRLLGNGTTEGKWCSITEIKAY